MAHCREFQGPVQLSNRAMRVMGQALPDSWPNRRGSVDLLLTGGCAVMVADIRAFFWSCLLGHCDEMWKAIRLGLPDSQGPLKRIFLLPL